MREWERAAEVSRFGEGVRRCVGCDGECESLRVRTVRGFSLERVSLLEEYRGVSWWAVMVLIVMCCVEVSLDNADGPSRVEDG